jgi:hypothetical protein
MTGSHRNRVAELDQLALLPRRCPQVGLSVAMRITSLRIAPAVDGCPGRRLLGFVGVECSFKAGVDAEEIFCQRPGRIGRQTVDRIGL